MRSNVRKVFVGCGSCGNCHSYLRDENVEEVSSPFNFHLPLISAPFIFCPFNFRPLGQKSNISPPLIFAPFEADKHFNT